MRTICRSSLCVPNIVTKYVRIIRKIRDSVRYGQKTYCTEFCVLWVHSVPDFEVSVYRGTALLLGRIKGHPRALSCHVSRKRHITSASRLLSSRSITACRKLMGRFWGPQAFHCEKRFSQSSEKVVCARAYYTVLYGVFCVLVQYVAQHRTFRTSYFVAMNVAHRDCMLGLHRLPFLRIDRGLPQSCTYASCATLIVH